MERDISGTQLEVHFWEEQGQCRGLSPMGDPCRGRGTPEGLWLWRNPCQSRGIRSK